MTGDMFFSGACHRPNIEVRRFIMDQDRTPYSWQLAFRVALRGNVGCPARQILFDPSGRWCSAVRSKTGTVGFSKLLLNQKRTGILQNQA